MRDDPWTVIVSTVLELAGIAAVVVGCALVAPWLGWIAGGICVFVCGAAVDPPNRVRSGGDGG